MTNNLHRTSVMTRKSKVKFFEDQMRKYLSDLIPNEGDTYKIEEDWKELVDSSKLTSVECKQQFYIHEFILTECNYVQRLHVLSQVIRQLFLCLQSSNFLTNYKSEEIFGNITDLFIANDSIWASLISSVISCTRETKGKIDPRDIFRGFVHTDDYFESYINFCLQQESLVTRIRECKENVKANQNFVTFLEFCENVPCCREWKLVDLMVEPMKRITRYPLLLNKIREFTTDTEEQNFLDLVIKKIERFTTNVNTQIRKKRENEVLQDFLLEMDEQDVWLAGDEEVISMAIEYLRLPIHLKTRTEQRCLLKRGLMKIVEVNRKKFDVIAILFSDVLILTRQRRSNKKLTLVKQMFFLDKLILKKSEVSNNAVILVYKNEVGLLSETLKLEIVDSDSRDQWCNEVEKAKRVFIAVRENKGTTLDIFDEKYNGIDYNQKKKLENEMLSSFRRTSSWLLTKESIEAIRKERNKERSSSTGQSFRRALSDPNLLDANELPEISEDIPSSDDKKFGSLRELKSSVRKKLSLDNSNIFSPPITFQRNRFSSTDSYYSDNDDLTKSTSSFTSLREVEILIPAETIEQPEVNTKVVVETVIKGEVNNNSITTKL